MKKTLMVVLMTAAFAIGMAISTDAEIFVKKNSDGTFLAGEIITPKKIKQLPSYAGSVSGEDVADVLKSNREGKQYIGNKDEFILLGIFPPKVERHIKQYGLSVRENGEWDVKHLQTKKEPDLAMSIWLSVCMMFIAGSISYITVNWRFMEISLVTKKLKWLMLTYCTLFIPLGSLAFSPPNVCCVFMVLFPIASLFVRPSSPVSICPYTQNHDVNWHVISVLCGFLGVALGFVTIGAVFQKPQPYVWSQYTIFAVVLSVVPLLIAEAAYRIKNGNEKWEPAVFS